MTEAYFYYSMKKTQYKFRRILNVTFKVASEF